MEPDAAQGAVADLAVAPVGARWLRAIGEYTSVLAVNEAVLKVVSESRVSTFARGTLAITGQPA